jgi:hypothetical protein
MRRFIGVSGYSWAPSKLFIIGVPGLTIVLASFVEAYKTS